MSAAAYDTTVISQIARNTGELWRRNWQVFGRLESFPAIDAGKANQRHHCTVAPEEVLKRREARDRRLRYNLGPYRSILIHPAMPSDLINHIT